MQDDWREETQLVLQNSFLYKILKEKCHADSAGDHVLSLVDEATDYAYQRTKTILRHMGEFTLHDGAHLFRVLNIMEKIIPLKTIENYSVPEIMLLILGAFFHDIGMAPDEKCVLSWKKYWDLNPTFSDDTEKMEYDNFKRYCSSKPDQVEQIEYFLAQGNNSKADLQKGYLVTAYIRETHALRAKEIIQADWNEKIKYRDTDLTVEFAQICFNHNEDALSLLELDGNYLCGPNVYACLPLLGVILRLSDILDFDAKRTPSILFSHLFVKNPVSIMEWNKHRSVEAWSISDKLIQFHAKCKHPAIEASIHSFCNMIDLELSTCNNIISSMNEFNQKINRDIQIKIPYKVDRSKIETKKDIFGKPIYLFKETQFSLSKSQVIDLLMGTKLYGNPEVALRELLQNSIDACLLREALEKSWGNSYSPEIEVKYSQEKGDEILEIIDNGTGMDQDIIDSYYSKIGSSFYKSSEFYDLKSRSNASFVPTSRFGIGILSCFMVSDALVVETRRVYGPHDSSDPINIIIEGQESIFWIKPGVLKTPGTSTKLILRKNKNPWDRMSEEQFISSVNNVIPNPPFKILIKSSSHEKIIDENSFMLIKADSLKNHFWENHENIREFKIELNDPSIGFVGSAIVAILERRTLPVKEFKVSSKSVDIDGDNYVLEKSISMNGNDINLISTSITIDDEGMIDSSTLHSTLAKSKSRVSLHGIEIPGTLFPDFWRTQKNQVELSWPFPLLIVVDICGNRDLDLNFSRTQIIMSEKWINFEEELAFFICSDIARTVSVDYWQALRELLIDNTKNEIFIKAIKRVLH
jgi:molecular chaperone HtpG